ncbi:hypothetical protein IG631_23390 [Alternaria alternata]|nr:hypothetical protein IG631_23390 [Alternaria alternata]
MQYKLLNRLAYCNPPLVFLVALYCRVLSWFCRVLVNPGRGMRKLVATLHYSDHLRGARICRLSVAFEAGGAAYTKDTTSNTLACCRKLWRSSELYPLFSSI